MHPRRGKKQKLGKIVLQNLEEIYFDISMHQQKRDSIHPNAIKL